jgi:hypothetical protein
MINYKETVEARAEQSRTTAKPCSTSYRKEVEGPAVLQMLLEYMDK